MFAFRGLWPLNIPLCVAVCLPWAAPSLRAEPAPAEMAVIAHALKNMSQAARAAIAHSQALIDDPAVGEKGMTGQNVLARAIVEYRAATGRDPLAGDPSSRLSRLLRFQMEAIVEATDSRQAVIGAMGTHVRTFVPAVFTRLVNDAFTRRAGAEAAIRMTAPRELIRNRKSLPDALESRVIKDAFLTAGWPRGQAYEVVASEGERERFRVLVPEYYTESCLTCHGSPKGSLDLTGYPREGAKTGDLGGVLSITVTR